MEITYHLKQYLRFGKKEVKDLIITAVVLGFILSFRNWGGAVFDINVGVKNWIGFAIITFVCLFIPLLVQKIVAIKKGYSAKFRSWYLGLIIAIYIAFISNGEWYVFLIGGSFFAVIPRLKLGFKGPKKYEAFQESEAFIAFMAPLTHLCLAYIFKSVFLSGATNVLVERAIMLNIALAIATMMPIPQIEAFFLKIKEPANLYGYTILSFSRWIYLFTLILTIALSVFLFSLSLIPAIVLSFVIAIVVGLIYLFIREL